MAGSKKALVVIDVQNCFINSHTQEIPTKIARHITRSEYNVIAFAQFVLDKNSNFYKLLDWKKFFTSSDYEIHRALQPFTTPKNVFVRSTYSVFKHKEFISFLQRNNINEVVICGIDSDGCVVASAFDAFDMGYKMTILKQLTASSGGQAVHHAALKVMKRNLEP